MKNLILLPLLGLFFYIDTYAQTEVDSLSNKDLSVELEAITVQADKTIGIRKKDNIFILSVAGSVFEKSESVWQGLNQVPLLKVQQEKLKVLNKDAIIEINGNQMLLSSEELRDYLSSLDARDVKRIEINPTPGAGYESNVGAIINIVLKEKLNSYDLGVSTRHGLRSEYYSSSNIKYALNLNKLNISTSYTFNHDPKTVQAAIEQQLFQLPSVLFDSKDKISRQSHQFELNLGHKPSKKTEIDFINYYYIEDGSSSAANISQSTDNQFIDIENKKNYLQLGQIIKHKFNDKLSTRSGVYEVFNNTNQTTQAKIEPNNNAFQKVASDIPIIIAFSDIIFQNKWGSNKFGIKYNNTNVSNRNEQRSILINGNFPFRYSEQILALYAEQIFSLAPEKSLTVGVRSESTLINSSFSSDTNVPAQKRNIRYTNPLFNITYDWSKEEVYHSFAFRSQIERPNYGYLNPFTQITSSVLLFAGDLNVDPSRIYSLQYLFYKGNWLFYAQLGYFNQFISTFYDLIDSSVVQTYQNFEQLSLGGIGIEYNSTLWEDKIQIRPSFSLNYIRFRDDNFTIDTKQTPVINVSFFSSVELGKTFFSVEYSLSPAYRDGLFKHNLSQYLNLNLNVPLSKNLDIIFFANDIFRTQIEWDETTVPNYYFSNNNYADHHAFGLRLSWRMQNKLFKAQNFEKIKDEGIDRLN